MNELQSALSQFWGHDSFRPFQAQSIDCVLRKKPSITVLPTGSGKSLCFQLPALLCDGVAVVVTPLIALMKDQVDSLTERGIAAASINSTQSSSERLRVADRIRNGELKLLYVSPERLFAETTLKFLQSQTLSFVAIDEAHCVSQWGHDFRPEYAKLKALSKALPTIPVHAFTATASARVREDISQMLGMESPVQIVGDFDRPNLTYRMIRTGKKLTRIMSVIGRNRHAPGMIYCNSRREVETTAAALHALGVPAKGYHAGMAADQRAASQEAFLKGDIEILVATVAFGMGVDKSDVRFVIHTGMPQSIEHYQQESGRAGRDGKPAECVLLYTSHDLLSWREILAVKGGKNATHTLNAMYDLCSGVSCRHKAIADYFGENELGESCEACDVCLGELELVEDPVTLAQKILSCVVRLRERYGELHTAKVLAGKSDERIVQEGHHQLSTFGLLSDTGLMGIRVWIRQLVEQGFLVRGEKYKTLSLTKSGGELLAGKKTVKLTAMSGPAPDSTEAFVPSVSSVASFEEFRAGKSIDAIANKLARAKSTVVKYLTEYLRYHRIKDPTPWVAPATARRVLEHRTLADDGKLKPLFDHFGGEVSYDDIRITLACASVDADRSDRTDLGSD